MISIILIVKWSENNPSSGDSPCEENKVKNDFWKWRCFETTKRVLSVKVAAQRTAAYIQNPLGRKRRRSNEYKKPYELTSLKCWHCHRVYRLKSSFVFFEVAKVLRKKQCLILFSTLRSKNVCTKVKYN